MAQRGSLPTICKQENIANAQELGFYKDLSQDSLELLYSMASATSNPFANRAKAEFISAVHRFADAEFIVQNPMLYGCSGIDIELPILLGARDITLRDKAFDGRLNHQLESRLKSFEHYEKQDGIYVVGHDYGKGEEEVKIRAENGDVRDLEKGTQYGFIMEFLGTGAMNDKFLDPEFTSHLMMHGYLRTDEVESLSTFICEECSLDELANNRQRAENNGFSLVSEDDFVFMLRKDYEVFE